jgi:hypothetical protein
MMMMPIGMSLRPARGGRGIVLLGAVVFLGCAGDDDLARRYPVSGKVTYKGEPLASGTITFTPAAPAEGIRPASGAIVDGRYQLTTQTTNDGAMAGKYKVSVVARSFDDPTDGQNEKAIRRDKMAKIIGKSAKNVIPTKFSLPETSELTAEVPGGRYDFDLQ